MKRSPPLSGGHRTTMAFPRLPAVPMTAISLVTALVEGASLSHFTAVGQSIARYGKPSAIASTPSPEQESVKSSDLLLRGVRLHEMSALVILVVCLVLTAALIVFVGFYCLVHCWRHHKESLTAAHRRALVQSAVLPTAVHEIERSSRVSSVGWSRLSIFGGRINLGVSGRSVRGRYADDLNENVIVKGKLPQIRISFSSAGNSSPDRCRSRLSTASSILPPWMEGRTSTVPTPQTPGSPVSLGSYYNGYTSAGAGKEPLLGIERPSTASFWQRLAGRPHSASSLPENGVIRLNMEGVQVDDREIDNRSVLHYELGSYEKTKTNCFRGTLTFSLRYDFIHRVLMLHVIRASHLFGSGCGDKDTKGAPVHPYVKMYLLPERRNHCKTRIMKKAADPEFNEMFSFDVAYNDLSHRMLQFTVYDFDRFTRHGLIGNVIMRDLFDKSELLQWTEYTMQIVGSQEKNDFGDLLLYLAYSIPSKKLFITVAKAYNLRPMDITGASDPYVRCEQIYQRKRIKVRKTSIKRANLNPVYHECLEFDLAPNQIDETNILIQVMDWDRIGRDDLLGCCVLGKESPTKEGRQQWEKVFNSVKCVTSNLNGSATVTSASLNGAVTVTSSGLNGTTTVTSSLNGTAAVASSLNGTATTTPSPAPASDSNSPTSSPTDENNTIPCAVGQWHSILGEVPDGFRNIPKANKKHVQRNQLRSHLSA